MQGEVSEGPESRCFSPRGTGMLYAPSDDVLAHLEALRTPDS